MSAIAMLDRIQVIQDLIVKVADPSAARAASPASGAASASTATTADTFSEMLKTVSEAAGVSEVIATGTVSAENPKGKTGDDIAAAAQKYVGVPYVWGGTDESGMDCSGFVQKVFGDLGIEMPRLARDQMFKGEPVDGFANALPGDLISSFDGEHISIYLGNGKAIDAPVPGQSIQVRDAWEMNSNLEKIVRVIPGESTGNSTAQSASTTSTDIGTAQASFLAGLAR